MDWKKEGRPIVKDVLNILLNISSRSAIYKMKDKFPDQRAPLKNVIPLIIEHHAPIGNYFFKVVSPRIMDIESDICNDIILMGMSDEVVVLPICDSFITNKNHNDYLMKLMSSSYKKRLEFDPIIH